MIRFWGKRTSFRKVRIKRPTIFVVPGLHIETLGPKSRVQQTERALPLLRQLLAACRADPFFGFLLPSPEVMRAFLDVFPEEREWVKQLISQERCVGLPLSTSILSEPIGGETLARALIHGSAFWETLAGRKPLLQWINEQPASCAQWPQLLHQAGILGVLSLMKPSGEDRPSWMNWVSPGNHSIPLHETRSTSTTNEGVLAALIEDITESPPDENCLLHIASSVWETPESFMIGHCRDLSTQEVPVTVSAGTAETFFAAHESNPKRTTPRDTIQQGARQKNGLSVVTRYELKTALRWIETALYETEAWQSVLHLLDLPVHRATAQQAWNTCITTAQTYAIGGNTNEVNVLDTLDQLRATYEQIHDERDRVLNTLASQVTTSTPSTPLSGLVFNSLPWQHDGLLSLETGLITPDAPATLYDTRGNEIPYEIDLHPEHTEETPRANLTLRMSSMPPTGFEGISIEEQEPSFAPIIQKQQNQSWMENDFLRVEIDPGRGGGIVSLYDKENDREWINPTESMLGNSLLWMEERAPGNDTSLPLSQRLMEASSDSPAEFTYHEGPLSKRLLIRGAGPGPCSRIQEIRTYHDAPYIDICTILEDFGGLTESGQPGTPNRDLYMAAFPLNAPGVAPIIDDRFHAASAAPIAGNLADLRHSDAKEIPLQLTPAQRWVDASWSLLFRFIEDSTEVASLAVPPSLIAFGESIKPDAIESLRNYLARHGVLYNAVCWNENQHQPERELVFCIGTEEQNPLTATILASEPHIAERFRHDLEQQGSVFLVIQTSAVFSSGKPTTVVMIAGRDESTLQSRLNDLAHGTVAHRYECSAASLLIEGLAPIDDSGLAFLCPAPISCGIHQQSVMVFTLGHYAPYRNPLTSWPSDFFEQHTVMNTMRLVPHAGDWRVAEIPRRAMEYTHAPRFVPVEAHQGVLSSRETFVSLEPGNMLVSSIKPTGIQEPKPPRAQSIIVRAYEAHGEESNLWMDCRQPIKTAKALTLLEEPLPERRDIFRENQFVRANAHAFEIVTLGIETKAEIRGDRKRVPTTEAATRFYTTRSWRMNDAPHGENAVPLSAVIRGQWRSIGHEQDRWIQHLDVVVSNRAPHDSISGEVTIETTEGLRTIPEQSTFRLQPGGYQVLPIHLLKDAGIQRGLIHARAQTGSCVVNDTFLVGEAPEYIVRMTLNKEGFHVHISHPYPYALPGTVHLITPFEAWPQSLVGDASISGFSPRVIPYVVPPGKETVASFASLNSFNPYRVPGDHHWVVVKICSVQTIRYYHIRLDGRQSEGLGCAFLPPYITPVQLREDG